MTTGENQTADVLTVEHDEGICIVRLNRPEALNAADARLHTRLSEIWTELEAEADCRAVVLTGNGRAFCAGGDLGVLERMNADPTYRSATLAEGVAIVQRMIRFPIPIIAAVNGPAVGLGCSLAGLSDIVLIEQQAYLADPHVSVGLVAGDGGALTWPLLTSMLRAKEYLFTGDRISAATAVEIGLANRVVAEGASVDEARALGKRLALQPAQALRDTKRAINKYLERSMLDILDLAIAAESIASASPEHAAIIERMRKRTRDA